MPRRPETSTCASMRFSRKVYSKCTDSCMDKLVVHKRAFFSFSARAVYHVVRRPLRCPAV